MISTAHSSHHPAWSIAALGMLAACNPASSAPQQKKEQTLTTTATSPTPPKAGAKDTIRPFHVEFSDEALADMKRRILAMRWPPKEVVADQSQGVQLATMQKLARYWVTDYDWRKTEAKLNALPNFITEIDGVDIHFIHVRSKQPNALPIIVTHGWPGSIIEQLKIIDPLTNPTAHGGNASDALPPCAVGLTSGSTIFSCSMIEPGHPCVTMSGRAFFSFERT